MIVLSKPSSFVNVITGTKQLIKT